MVREAHVLSFDLKKGWGELRLQLPSQLGKDEHPSLSLSRCAPRSQRSLPMQAIEANTCAQCQVPLLTCPSRTKATATMHVENHSRCPGPSAAEYSDPAARVVFILARARPWTAPDHQRRLKVWPSTREHRSSSSSKPSRNSCHAFLNSKQHAP